jgi:hypothetical protein
LLTGSLSLCEGNKRQRRNTEREFNTRLMLVIMRTANKTADVRTNVTLRNVRVKCFCSGKIISIENSEFLFVVLAIQQAEHMGHIILPSVANPALRQLFTLSHTRHDFRRNVIEHKMYNLVVPTNFIQNISHSKKKSDHPRRYPYFEVVVGLVWSHDPESYAGGSVCYW